MTKEEILSLVRTYIMQAKAGLEVENPKVDFKACWYNLTTAYGINEFVKDTSAIANTFGLDGFIIVGYDEKVKCLSNAKFLSCGLKNTSQIQDLINKKVDRLFDINIYDVVIDEIEICIIHIPPSIDKPHVIRLYQSFDKDGNIKKVEDQKIFVRKGSTTRPAGKNDLELMYYDRKNIIPEYKILSSFKRDDFLINTNRVALIATPHISFENLGRRPICISSIKLNFQQYEDASGVEILEFESSALLNYTVQPGELITIMVSLNYPLPDWQLAVFNDRLISAREQIKNIINTDLQLTLTNGKKISSELVIW
jgi:Predicted transcriptional regulator containing an HTH domain and an uncharacterized domain shared with the mammalian protein Schlafen